MADRIKIMPDYIQQIEFFSLTKFTNLFGEKRSDFLGRNEFVFLYCF